MIGKRIWRNEFMIENVQNIDDSSPIFILLLVWSFIWKLIALWHAGRNKQLIWFVVLSAMNTFGILEMVYLRFYQKKEPEN